MKTHKFQQSAYTLFALFVAKNETECWPCFSKQSALKSVAKDPHQCSFHFSPL